MALSEEIKNLIIADFDTGDFSQRELVIKHKVGKGTISRLLKGRAPKNGALKDKAVCNHILQVETDIEMGQLNGAERRSLQKSVMSAIIDHDKTNRIASTYQDILEIKQSSSILVLEKLKELRDEEIKKAETPERVVQILAGFDRKMEELVDMGAIKQGVEANDRASVTIGDNERFAPRAVQAVQLNTSVSNTDVKIIDDDMDDSDAVQIYLDMIKSN